MAGEREKEIGQKEESDEDGRNFRQQNRLSIDQRGVRHGRQKDRENGKST